MIPDFPAYVLIDDDNPYIINLLDSRGEDKLSGAIWKHKEYALEYAEEGGLDCCTIHSLEQFCSVIEYYCDMKVDFIFWDPKYREEQDGGIFPTVLTFDPQSLLKRAGNKRTRRNP